MIGLKTKQYILRSQSFGNRSPLRERSELEPHSSSTKTEVHRTDGSSKVFWEASMLVSSETKKNRGQLTPVGGIRKFGFERRQCRFLVLNPPLLGGGLALSGGCAILARPQKWPFLVILRVKSAKMRDLRLRPEEVAFKPALIT
jgi:hypothetical protein